MPWPVAYKTDGNLSVYSPSLEKLPGLFLMTLVFLLQSYSLILFQKPRLQGWGWRREGYTFGQGSLGIAQGTWPWPCVPLHPHSRNSHPRPGNLTPPQLLHSQPWEWQLDAPLEDVGSLLCCPAEDKEESCTFFPGMAGGSPSSCTFAVTS